MFAELSKKQVKDKFNFISNYIKAANAADGSKFDANSNVSNKNIATLNAEVNKDINIQLNRAYIYDRLTKMYNQEAANDFLAQLEEHSIYVNDETQLLTPYCVAVTLYPFVTNGLKGFGGDSEAPKHLSSYCGGYINLMFALSSQYVGAVATVEFLLFFNYFAIKDYGVNYLETHTKEVVQELQSVVYAINQPASARGYQSCFSNWSIFDKNYFISIFEHFKYPDGSDPNYKDIDKLQRFFMDWFNKEREKALLTFPVITASCLHNNKTIEDTNFKEFIAEEYSKGNAFFTFTSDEPYALSSCCRLLSKADEVNEFSYTLGAGGVQAGSKKVITLNLPMVAKDLDEPSFLDNLKKMTKNVHKYLFAHNEIYKELIEANLLPAYTNGYIKFDKQYLTVGFNGLVEVAEYYGYTPNNNEDYINFYSKVLRVINETNTKATEETGIKINLEQIPAESTGVKFAKWNKEAGLDIKRICQNSYIFPVEDSDITVLDKIKLHGKPLADNANGGSACHLNLEAYPTKEACMKLLDYIVQEGCNYFCFNVKVTKCKDCGRIDKNTKYSCTYCGSSNIVHCTRVIGYLKEIDNFSKERQIEEANRKYHTV